MSGITITPDSGTEFTANAAEWNSVCRLDDNNYAVAYRDNNDGNKGKVNVGSRTGTSVTISELNAVIFNNANTDKIKIASLSSSLIVISYRDINSGKPYVVACSISGVTITVGTPVLILNNANLDGISIAVLDSSDFVVTISGASSFSLESFVGSVSGTVITLGSAQSTGTTAYYLDTIGLDGTHFALIYENFSSPATYAIGGTVNVGAKTISFGTGLLLLASEGLIVGLPIVSSFDSTHFIVCFMPTTDPYIVACSINLGTLVITKGTAIQTGATGKSNFGLCCITATNFILSYYTTTGTQAEVRSGTLTGDTTIAWDAQGPQIFDNTTTAYTALCALTSSYFIVGYKEG